MKGPSDISEKDPLYADFQARVLNAIGGGTPQDPRTKGKPVTWSLFNQPEDNTRLLIMTPAIATWRGRVKDGEKEQVWMYKNKIADIKALVTKNVPGVAVRVRPYKRLDYQYNNGNPQGPDAARVGQSARGFAFFQ